MSRLVAAFLLLVSLNAQALLYREDGTLGGWEAASASAIAGLICGGYGDFHYPDETWNGTMWVSVSRTTANAGIPDTSYAVYCGTFEDVVVSTTIFILPTCVYHQDSLLTNLTTVAAIDEFGNMTAATSPTNPQCNNGCVSSAEEGLPVGFVCSAWRNPSVAFAVGAAVWVSCAGSSGTPIRQTGETCNMGASDVTGVEVQAAKPLGYVAVEAEGDDEGEEGGGGALGTAVDTTAVCVDANGDGKHDTLGTACSVLAAEAIKNLSDGQREAMEQVGQGATLIGDVNTLSNNNGGWFLLPESISNFFNPPASCNYAFTLPTIGSFSGTVTVTKWCDVKTAIEPYLAFAMFTLTAFVGFSQFRRV